MVTNDVSARDVQLPKTQFYEGKSYPTFTPVGPALVLLDADELKRFTDLRLRLSVNGELRQDRTVADMIYLPVQALRALTRFQRLDPGDLLLTGTPVGTALSAPPKPVEILTAFLPPATKWRLFFQARPKTASTCRTATSSRPPWPPTTAPSTWAPSAPPCGTPDDPSDLLWPGYATPDDLPRSRPCRCRPRTARDHVRAAGPRRDAVARADRGLRAAGRPRAGRAAAAHVRASCSPTCTATRTCCTSWACAATTRSP